MNWKPSFSRCLVMSFGLTLAGCGAATDPGSQASSTASQQSSETATNVNLVTLDLPGMT